MSAQITAAAHRGAALTRQLLAFSRQTPIEPKVLSLNVAVAYLEPMLRRLIGATIVVSTVLAQDAPALMRSGVSMTTTLLAKDTAHKTAFPVFTPGGVYRSSMPVNGRSTVVRRSDGIHLNAAGSAIAARLVLTRLAQDFSW